MAFIPRNVAGPWQGVRRTLALAAAVAFTACAPAEEEGPSAAELEQFRQEVTQALEAVRAELQDLQERISEEAPEEWSHLSTVAETTRDEVMADLQRLTEASAEEVKEVRRAAARRLAGLEAEVVQREVNMADDLETLRMVAEHHLAQLEDNLSEVARRSAEALSREEQAAESQEDPAQDALPMQDTDRVTPDRIAEIEDEIQVLRDWVERVTDLPEEELEEEYQEDFETLRQDVGESMGEITRKVRALWYSTRWQATVA